MSVWWTHQPKRTAWGRGKYWPIHWPWGGQPRVFWGPRLTRTKDNALDAKHFHFRKSNVVTDPLERLIRWRVNNRRHNAAGDEQPKEQK